MDKLYFNRIWEDQDFFELEIRAETQIICSSVKTYITNVAIDELSKVLELFLVQNEGLAFWENGKKGNNSTPYVSLSIGRKDKYGHILLEIYMEIDDGGDLSKHNCCFYIETEVGLLEDFQKSLSLLKEPGIGCTIVLNNIDK